MKKPWTYGLSVVIAALLIFAYVGMIGGFVLKFKALRAQTALKLVSSEQLVQKVHDSLETYYKTQENTSGITADTYEDAISNVALEPLIRQHIEKGFGYVVDRSTNDLTISADFSEFENDMTAFFVRYANENNYQRDDVFHEKLDAAIAAAEENIIAATDIFRFDTLEEAGYLGKLRAVASWADLLLYGSVVIIVLLLLLLLMLYHKERAMVCYWAGTAVLVGSVLMLIPAVHLQATRWFDRFAVKEDAVFSAVTGYLYTITGAVITAAIVGIVLAAAIYVLFGIVSHAAPDPRKARKKTAKSTT